MAGYVYVCRDTSIYIYTYIYRDIDIDICGRLVRYSSAETVSLLGS